MNNVCAHEHDMAWYWVAWSCPFSYIRILNSSSYRGFPRIHQDSDGLCLSHVSLLLTAFINQRFQPPPAGLSPTLHFTPPDVLMESWGQGRCLEYRHVLKIATAGLETACPMSDTLSVTPSPRKSHRRVSSMSAECHRAVRENVGINGTVGMKMTT